MKMYIVLSNVSVHARISSLRERNVSYISYITDVVEEKCQTFVVK